MTRTFTDRQRKAMFAKRRTSPRLLIIKSSRRPTPVRFPLSRRGKTSRGEALLTKHEGLVRKLAQRFVRQYPTVELDDVLQEGRIGLLRAGQLYRKQPGAQFSTYASHHIMKRMREMAQSTLHALHVPERKLRSGKGKPPAAITIRGKAGRALMETLSTSGGIPRAEARGTLQKLFKKHLTPLEQKVMVFKHLNGQLTYRAISKKTKKSLSSIHKLERAAFAKLRRASLARGRSRH